MEISRFWVEIWPTLPKLQLRYVLAACALVTAFNVTVGIFLGLFLTLILFAVEYSSITGVWPPKSVHKTASFGQQFNRVPHLLWSSA